MAPKSVLRWLLEPDQPSVRWRALTQLEHRPASDPDVRAARAAIPARGWVADLLASRDPAGWWVHEESLYTPKYLSTNFVLLTIADLGGDRSDARIRASVELWARRFALAGGGVGGNSKGTGHHCIVGNMARAMIQMGYADDPRVRRSLEWLEETADPKGGWSCWGVGRNLDSWEGLSAFAALPRAQWTAGMTRVVERGAEFFLERELHRQGAKYAPWYRFHYPVHYYYDLLVGLEILTALGYGDDPRMRPALDHLESRRRRDGRWVLDANHPDVVGPPAKWYAAHPGQRPRPLRLERAGQPSKMVTLRALTVLDRAGR